MKTIQVGRAQRTLIVARYLRDLTPLFWQHILLYGEVKLDMTKRLDIRTDTLFNRPPGDPLAAHGPSDSTGPDQRDS